MTQNASSPRRDSGTHRTLPDFDHAFAPDPTHALIAAHRAAYAEWASAHEVWDAADPGSAACASAAEIVDRLSQPEAVAYEALFTAEPTTLAGASALAQYLSEAVQRVRVNVEVPDGERGLCTISAAIARLVGGGSAGAPRRDWKAFAAIHPGFVPYPAHAPVLLASLDSAIRGEAGRLLELAEAEIKRLKPAHAGNPDPTVWLRVERELRREMRMDALAAVASDELQEGTPDPALAAFDASRRAEAEMAAFGHRAPTPLTPELRTQEDALCKAQREARDAAWGTVPTTREGRRALVDFARLQIEVHTAPDGSVDNAEELIEQIVGAFGAAVAAERPETTPGTGVGEAATVQANPVAMDALALVGAIEAEWTAQTRLEGQEQDEAEDEARSARRSHLIAAADALPADGASARHAKALALAWIVSADQWRPGWTRDAYTTDGRLAFDIDASLRGAAAAEHPDAALLALGPMIAELVAASDRANALHADAEERSFDMIGPVPTKPKDIQLYPTDEAYHAALRRYDRECAAHAKRRKRAEKATHLTALEEAANEADSALLRETRRLADMRATTLEGLMLKARWVERGADEELKDGITADLLAMGGER